MTADREAGASAELDDLARLAREDAPAAPDAERAPGAAAPSDTVQEWDDAIAFAVSLASAAYPSIAPIYTDDARRRLAQAVHAVGAKYNFTVSALFAKYAAEINLAMIGFPLVKATADAIRADKAARDAKPAPAVAPAAGEGGEAVAPRPAKPGALTPNT